MLATFSPPCKSQRDQTINKLITTFPILSRIPLGFNRYIALRGAESASGNLYNRFKIRKQWR